MSHHDQEHTDPIATPEAEVGSEQQSETATPAGGGDPTAGGTAGTTPRGNMDRDEEAIRKGEEILDRVKPY